MSMYTLSETDSDYIRQAKLAKLYAAYRCFAVLMC